MEAASFLKQAVGDVNVWVEDTLTESLDGFLLVVDSDGAILYVSESVALYLGLTQVSARSNCFVLVFRMLMNAEVLHGTDF